MSYRRSQETKKRLKKLCYKTEGSSCAGAYYDEDKHRYIKYGPNRSSGNTKYLRKQANKKIRKAKDELNYGSYKKKYDYWWILY